MVIVTGNLGILSQSRLERVSSDVTSNAGNTNVKLNDVLERVKKLESKEGALPRSITKKRQKEDERGLLGGRFEEGQKKLEKLQKKKPDLVDLKPSIFDSLFIALGIKGSGASAVGSNFGKVLSFAQKGVFAQAVFSSFLTRVIPAAIVVKIATAVWKIYKAQYGKGGTRDIRKLILDEDVSRIGIENENELESGANLFLSNPQLLTGLPRGPSNTENLREGMARWKQRHEGTYGR